MFALRIISFDHYLLPEGMPVIRIFGSTSNGQKTCIHMHDIYPYFYLKYEGEQTGIQNFIHQLKSSIDRAVSLSFNSNSKPTTYVKDIILVKGIPFYGFHSGYAKFLKVYIYNPSLMSRIVGLLENGAVMGQNFSVYESHIPFLLQFLVDYNLYGMDYINLSFFKARMPILSIYLLINRRQKIKCWQRRNILDIQ